MKKTKGIILQLPEYLLILSVLFYWYSSAVILNPIAIVLLLFLIFQIISQNKTVGIIIPTLLICGSLFMLLALLSEFNEFPTFSPEARQLLLVGLTYFLSTIMVAGIMIYKYILKNIEHDAATDAKN